MANYELGKYAQGAISGDELQEAMNAAMREVLADPTALDELARYGVDVENLRDGKFLVEQKPGIGPAAVILAIGIAAAGELTADGVKALWRLVLRRVRTRKGGDAVGEEQPT